jgi:aldehyde:ferredoxin oxidoreductase
MPPHAWNGKILWVDLTSGNTQTEQIDERVYHEFIGGKGLGTYLLYRELDAGIDPLGPDNVALFLTGPLQGLPAPNVGRWTLVTKSPLTGLYLDTHCGGPLGREIKNCGYDAIGVRGRSDKPTTIVVSDDSVTLDDASNVWGKGTQESTRILHESFEKGSAVYVIGPTGESLLPIAVGCCEYAHQTGRGGAGAVLGSKNLKGIVVKGSRSVTAADVDEIRSINRALTKGWNKKTDYGFKDYGTAFLVELSNARGQFPTRNWQSGFFETHEGLDPARMSDEWGLGRHHSCPHCVMRCTHSYRTEDPSRPGIEVESTVEYETLGLMGGNLGIDDPQGVLRLNYLCDDLGLDTISTGGIVGFAMEAFERGILTKEDVGFELRFGDTEAALELVKLISARKGIGDLLADGVKKAAERIGRGSEEFAVHVKGLELPAWDPRGRRGLGISYATADVGASHLRGWPQAVEMPDGPAKDAMDSLVENRDTKILTDSLVVCHFTYHLPLEHQTKIDLLNAATGLNYDASSIAQFANRVETLARMFNLREGIARKDDSLPPRFWEPEPNGPAKGMAAFMSQEDFSSALERFYELRGWDTNGIPKAATVDILGLRELVGPVTGRPRS